MFLDIGMRTSSMEELLVWAAERALRDNFNIYQQISPIDLAPFPAFHNVVPEVLNILAPADGSRGFYVTSMVFARDKQPRAQLSRGDRLISLAVQASTVGMMRPAIQPTTLTGGLDVHIPLTVTIQTASNLGLLPGFSVPIEISISISAEGSVVVSRATLFSPAATMPTEVSRTYLLVLGLADIETSVSDALKDFVRGLGGALGYERAPNWGFTLASDGSQVLLRIQYEHSWYEEAPTPEIVALTMADRGERPFPFALEAASSAYLAEQVEISNRLRLAVWTDFYQVRSPLSMPPNRDVTVSFDASGTLGVTERRS